MKRFSIHPLMQRVTGVAVAVLLLLGIGIQDATAQFEQKSMDVGELHQVYNESGGNQEFWADGNDFDWPGIYQRGAFRAGALWIGARNVTDENGREWPARVVHVGPRVTGAGVFLPQEFETIQQFEDPTITVDGIETLDRAADVDQVDPSIPAHRIIRTRVNTVMGVSLEKRVLGWGQEYHGNYHIHEYTMTNTGNIDSDEEAELDQPLEDVYLHFQRRWTFQDRVAIPGSGWGANVMNDVVGDGMDDYDVDFTATYTWLGNSPGFDIDPLGGPARDSSPSWIPEGQDGGELSTAWMVGTVTLDATPSNDDDNPPPGLQPSMTGYVDSDAPILSTNSPFNETQMQDEYQFMSQARPENNNGPHMFPHHADVVDEDGDFTTADGNPMLERPGGWSGAFSYGPYDLDIGESITVVMALAADGLNQQEQVVVGRAFKSSDFDPEAPIEIDYINELGERINPDVQQGKNDWAVTAAKDSLFSTFERAIANYESGYNIPLPPPPPTSFTVNSGVGEISLEWTADSDPPGGFEIYRAAGDVRGDWRSANETNEDGVNFGAYQYERIAELDGSARSFTDESARRGLNYYYYILSVGEPNTDGTGLTPTGKPLRSSRYWTQTYNPASLARPPGEEVSDFKVVPNPYNLGSDPEIRYPDDDEKIGFLNIPGNSVIRIYTELGELVRTIRHDDGSGDEFWNLATDDRQLVVSGIYIAVVEDLETGDQSTKKFVIIR